MGRSFKVLAIHKQMYPGTYNFRDEANGTSGNDIDGFHDYSTNDTNGQAMIIASENGHKKILKIYGDGDNGKEISIYFGDETATSGTVEYWVKYVDNGVGALGMYFFDNAANIMHYSYIYANTNKVVSFHGNGAGGNTTIQTDITSDIRMHFRWEFDCATDTQSLWLDGINIFDGENFQSDLTSVSYKQTRLRAFANTGANAYEYYIDAIGFSWDANYNIGDNVHWRYYKDQDSNFESEDVGTTGTTIACVDGGNDSAHCEIVQFYSEHKKVLRFFDDDTSSDAYIGLTQSTADIIELWFRENDTTTHFKLFFCEDATQCFYVKLALDNIYDTNDVDIGNIADDTWYHLIIQWYVDNTYDVWLNNILILDGGALDNNQVSGINRLHVYGYGNDNAKFIYLDAISQISLSTNNKGDNRIFDYNATYTSEDITTDVINVLATNQLGKWLEGVLTTKETYENTEIFVQIYDVNDKLGMEAELSDRIQATLINNIWVPGEVRTYPLRDKNEDDLKNESSNTFSVAKIHDPTDSTCMLKVILPNIGETEGDLLLVDADTKTDTYSPTTKNYPDYLMLTDIADLADSVVIIHPDGKCYLDDDKSSGTSLDVDIAADKAKMTEPPLVSDILEEVNYIVVKGAINPDTGTRFVKVTDTVGSDKKKSWRYTNNNFLNQTDVDNYAAKLVARAITAKKIKFSAQSLGAHNMGETIDYKFVDSLYNIPQANYYVIFEQIDYDKNLNVIILSEGMLETSKYAAAYEKPEEYNDAYASQIYDTDMVSFSLFLYPFGGAAYGEYGRIEMTAANQLGEAVFYTSDKIDTSRPIKIYYVFYIAALAADSAVYVRLKCRRRAVDCSSTTAFSVFLNNKDLTCTTASKYTKETEEISASDVYAETYYTLDSWLLDGPPADLRLLNIMVEYYQKRSV